MGPGLGRCPSSSAAGPRLSWGRRHRLPGEPGARSSPASARALQRRGLTVGVIQGDGLPRLGRRGQLQGLLHCPGPPRG